MEPVTIVTGVLFVVSELLGAVDKVPANGIVDGLLRGFKACVSTTQAALQQQQQQQQQQQVAH
jgi:hypothetical protein